MPWGIAAAGIAGAGASIYAADKASDAGLDAADQQAQVARETRDIVRRDQRPFREAGYSALNQLLQLTGVPAPQSVTQAATGGSPTGFPEDADPVTRSYYEVLGRAPDPEGLRYYQKEGLSYDQLVQAHRGSSEYQDRFRRGLLPPSESPGKGSANFKPQGGAPVQGGQQAPGGGRTIEEMVKTDPSYQFRLDEGTRALERSRSAAGGLLSGGTGRKLTRYAQDYASTEYGKIYDRIANIAGLGQTSAANTAQGTVQTGGLLSNAYGNAGFARASGYVAQGNAISNALNQGALAYGMSGGRGSSISQIDRSGFPQRVTGSIRGG